MTVQIIDQDYVEEPLERLLQRLFSLFGKKTGKGVIKTYMAIPAVIPL